MELDSNLTLLLIAVIVCSAVFLATVLKGIQRGLDSIVKYAEEKRQEDLKNWGESMPGDTPVGVTKQEKSKFKTFRSVILTGSAFVLAFAIQNYDKIADYINPDPFAETNKKLAKIADQMQPSVEILLPDSIEQRDDVKQIRSMQDKITYFNLNLRLLQEQSNNKSEFDADTTMVNYYQSLLIDFQKINQAFGQVMSGIMTLPNVYAYMNASILMDYLKIQDNYNKIEKETLEGLTPMTDSLSKTKPKDMKKFKKIMVKLVDESYYQADRQIELIKRVDIALNLALLDIKSDAINNSGSPLNELMRLLGGSMGKDEE